MKFVHATDPGEALPALRCPGAASAQWQWSPLKPSCVPWIGVKHAGNGLRLCSLLSCVSPPFPCTSRLPARQDEF